MRIFLTLEDIEAALHLAFASQGLRPRHVVFEGSGVVVEVDGSVYQPLAQELRLDKWRKDGPIDFHPNPSPGATDEQDRS